MAELLVARCRTAAGEESMEMNGATLREWFALILLGSVMGGCVYAHVSRWPFRIVPVLVAICTIVTAIELLPSGLGSWQWASAMAGVTIGGALGGYLITGQRPSGRQALTSSVQFIRGFTSDRRLVLVAAATILAICTTAPFGRWAKAENPPGFWASFYASWTANLLFFAFLGAAGIFVSFYRPEKDDFGRRVRILFGGRQDAAVDYITEIIRKIGYYAEEVVRTYTILEFDQGRNAALIKVTHRTVTRNFYDDLTAEDTAMISLIPDPLVPPLTPIGYLSSFSVNGVNRLKHRLDILPGAEFTHSEAIEIPKGGKSDLEVVWQGWYALSELHEFGPIRFAKIVRIELEYEGSARGMSVPIVVEVPQQERIRLAFGRKYVAPAMMERPPGKAAFAFRLSLPDADP